MKNIFLVIISALFIIKANANIISSTLDKTEIQANALMTKIDRLNDSISNITIQNTSGAQTFTITGIFIQQLFQSNCTTSYFNNNGDIYGAMWSTDITLNPSASMPLGAGYLYSMVMNYLYEAAQNSGPVVTTPGSGAGTWCVQLGILQGGPAQYPTYTVNTDTSPSANLSNVVTWTNNTSPAPIAITCSDTTQNCTANSSVTQAFPL